MDGQVTIFELEGHPTPESIVACATKVTSDIDVFEQALNSKCAADDSKLKDAIYYFGAAFMPEVELSIIEKYVNKKGLSQ